MEKKYVERILKEHLPKCIIDSEKAKVYFADGGLKKQIRRFALDYSGESADELVAIVEIIDNGKKAGLCFTHSKAYYQSSEGDRYQCYYGNTYFPLKEKSIVSEKELRDVLSLLTGKKSCGSYIRENPSNVLLYCPFCGTAIDGDSIYCQFCGKRVAEYISETEEQSIWLNYETDNSVLSVLHSGWTKKLDLLFSSDTLEMYRKYTVLVRFENMDTDEITPQFILEDNYTMDDVFANAEGKDVEFAPAIDLEWGDWIDEDICELHFQILRRGYICAKVTVTTVENPEIYAILSS